MYRYVSPLSSLAALKQCSLIHEQHDSFNEFVKYTVNVYKMR